MAPYAWLLRVDGQQRISLRLLDDALGRAPSDDLLRRASEQLARDWPLADTELRSDPVHAAPSAIVADPDDEVPSGAAVEGTAILMDEGGEALLVRGIADTAQALWIRNGLGQTRRILARRGANDPGLDMVTLRSPLPSPVWQTAAREPYAGSPGCLIEYAPDPLGGAAWPLLRQGFFAGVRTRLPTRPLGFGAPRGVRRGPVFDATGQFVGVALAGAPDQLIGLNRLRTAQLAPLAQISQVDVAPRVDIDATYAGLHAGRQD